MHIYLAVISILILSLPISFVLQYAHHKNKIPKELIHPKTYINTKLEIKLSAVIYTIILIVIPVTILMKKDGIIIPEIWNISLAVICLGSTFILAWRHFKVSKVYSKHKKLIVSATALLTLIVSVVVSAITDIFISEITLAEASAFPVAQKCFTIIMSIFAWTYVATAIGMLAYTVIGIWLLIAPQSRLSKRNTKYMGEPIKRTISQKLKYELFKLFSIYFGLLLAIIIIPTYAAKIVSSDWFNKASRELLVLSSFHLPPSVCGLTDVTGSSITQIRYKYAIVAVPDAKTGYKFSTAKCNPKIENMTNR